MRTLLRVAVSLLIAVPIVFALIFFWALQGGRNNTPAQERPEALSDERHA